jgi:O-methyltransferase involved in polyketide biosynthesis
MHLTRWLRPGSHTISPTALYTGQVWQAHGLGDPALGSLPGRIGYAAAHVAQWPVELAGGPTLPQLLLARHRVIDHLLEGAVLTGDVGQVVELAAGLSPRGLRLRRAHPEVTYVEVDLPDMARRKRRALDRADALGPRHRVEAADVFTPELEEVFTTLDPRLGVAVVTEGLLNYFPTPDVTRLWGRLATATRDHPHGLYLSDLILDDGVGGLERFFAAGLGLAVRGGVHFHFAGSAEAESALVESGFTTATLHRPADFAGRLPGMSTPGAGRVHVVEART